MAMTWQSSSWNKERRLVRPWPPAPMMATFTLSLGATKPGPPRTWRGRIVVAATADAAVVMNSRRLVSDVFFSVIPFLDRVFVRSPARPQGTLLPQVGAVKAAPPRATILEPLRSRGIFLVPILLAAALRFPAL